MIRALLKAAAFLLAGAGVTFGLSCVIAATFCGPVDATLNRTGRDTSGDRFVAEYSWPGLTRVHVGAWGFDANAEPPGRRAADDGPPKRLIPDWADFMLSSARGGPVWNSPTECVLVTAGWPFPAFYGAVEFPCEAPPFTPVTRTSLLIGGPARYWMDESIVPLHPIPLGFATDSVIFGASCAMLWFGAARIRSGLRRSRGLCVRCKYPCAVGVVCPECGTSDVALRSI